VNHAGISKVIAKPEFLERSAMIALREYTEADIHLLVAYLNNTNVTRHLTASIPQPYTEKDAAWWIREGSRNGFVCAIEYNGIFVGTVGATRGLFERCKTAEIGYWIGEPFWGRGIATVALAQHSAFIFQNTDIVRLHAHVFARNVASMRVLEKCSYKCEAILEKAAFKNGTHTNIHLYASIKP
jgi:RimJ/RimL family protein N-acetyltransferase